MSRNRRWTISIGARLTLIGATVVFILGALLCAGLYIGLRVGLTNEVDAFLEGEIAEFETTIVEHWPDQSSLTEALRHELGSRPRGELAFRLLDSQGRVVISSLDPDPVGACWRNPDGWLDGPPRFLCTSVRPAGSSVAHRTCSVRTMTPDGIAVTAQASYRLDIMEALLARFRQVCLVALGCALLASLGAGRYLAHRLLRPIASLALTAAGISGQRLSDRVPSSANGDELDRLAQTINAMLARIESHVAQVRQLTADASHELRTPIAALRGKAEVALARGASAAELQGVLAESIEEFDRLTRITEDLLLLSRADAGQQILRIRRFRLDEALDQVSDLYRPLAESRGVELNFEPCGTDEWMGDDARLKQVVGNLLDNAIRFTPTGGRVAVSLARSSAAFVLSIRDTGSGIAQALLPRVFDRFYRADPARSRERGGAGLGLAICKTLVEAHGGSIRLQSDPGKGTTAIVTLPFEGQAPAS